MIKVAATSSPVASIVFSVLALLVISIVVLFILRYYLPLRTTPAELLVPVFFALWLPASMVLLVPIDLASSALADDIAARGIWLDRGILRVSWRIVYWLTFALTWFILPVLGEFFDSGYREPKDRVVDSLRANAQYYAIVFGSGFIALLYVLYSYGGFSDSLKGTVMALAYCWGLALAIYLMGHGLVAIPRRLFRNASISGKLRRIQAQAPKVYEKMEDAEMTLEDLEVQVSELSRRKGGSVTRFQDWIEELVDMTNLPESGPSTARVIPGSGDSNKSLPTVITEKYMADITRQLVRAKHARSRYVSEWNRLLQDAVTTQAILDSAASKKLDLGAASPTARFWDKHTILTPYTRFILHFHIVPYLRIALGGILALASVFIVWSEVIKGLFPNLSVIRYSVIHHWQPNGPSTPVRVATLVGEDNGQVGFAGQVISAFWMLYMCAAALTSITEVKVWRGRALVRRNTAPESAFWYASQVARLSVPLSYNFMTFLGGIYRETVFYDFLGQLIDLTSLGECFDQIFPAFILVPVSATLFGLYGKAARKIGFGVDVIDDEDDGEGRTVYGTGSWREGRDLIERELNGTSAAIRGRRVEAAARIAGGRAAPILSVPGSHRAAGPTTPLETSPNARPGANTSARRAGASSSRIQDDDEEEGFFGALGHRFRNTIDTMDTPKWFQDIKKPKWMGGDDEDGGSSGPSQARTNSDVRRWFGGGGEGRIRL
ncbi:LMBR1-like membrane protein-domain-containing protein [Podospora aff. communis PSN243]|uniref:LMBR1-like membrane protein-domain-containing protein n=1 Tax=Podospora aff. communis PSN243 TaxID=3040156 RepID=A0AAV9H634_9PEZI|nr:LMBR1-like membrane protein-domain-containing protein [Podospora aff. communis PSN243]